eukprot:6380105-Pyramimonas_sp.AAC.1
MSRRRRQPPPGARAGRPWVAAESMRAPEAGGIVRDLMDELWKWAAPWIQDLRDEEHAGVGEWFARRTQRRMKGFDLPENHENVEGLLRQHCDSNSFPFDRGQLVEELRETARRKS